LSIALSAVFFPIFNFLKKHLKAPWVASLLTVLIFLIVLCIPIFTIGTMVFKQSQSLYAWALDHGGFDNITKIFNRSIQNVFPNGAIDLHDGITALFGKFSESVGNIFTATLSTIFSLFLVILSMFYFLKDGISWKQVLVHFSPLSDESGNKIFSKLNTAINGIVKGYLLIALVQGLLMGIGLYIFGVPNSALWGLFAAIASLVPTIGTALVAIPAFIFLLVAGRTGAAIGFAIWAAALVGSIDNFLNPYFVGKKINIHPLIVLFSVLGGVILFGPIGILIGPLAISFLYALSSIYKTEIAS
jgi:predicted PurR-regulated permease PerM